MTARLRRSAGAIVSGAALEGERDLSADVIVVGSGSGGAVTACELANAGLEVLVLEEGPHVANAELGQLRPSLSLRRVWREGGMTAALGVGGSPVINVTMGRCVGGSSVVTGGVCFRTPDEVLHAWATERGLPAYSPESMDRYFSEVERDIHVEVVPEHRWSRSTALFAQGARRLGADVRSMRRNTRDCNGCGRCNFGCPHGAKLSVDLSYLPRAVAAGANVICDALVERVVTQDGRAVGVRGRFANGAAFTARARAVVVAAGAVHTPLLLMRSGIGRRSGQLGKNMTLHPSFRMMARFDEPVRGWDGALQGAYTDTYAHERVTAMGLYIPPSTIAAGIPGIGPDFMERAGGVDRVAIFGGLIHDEGGGRVWRVPGREPLMTYRFSKADRAAIPSVMRRLGDAFFAAGARELYLPILGHAPVDADTFAKLDFDRVSPARFECSSQHPLGTCRMGPDAASSVTDEFGRVWELPNLYLADGSVVPTSLGVNPQLTILALALRLSRGIATSL
ncbi:MAG: GMC family oxidoreductase [Myxococcales bacterium]|nr:GMC family oxidoreductase [Myxococcales bacterium]MCB9530830.1 GMC family oxidoreductase [Myxococcales bacterium]